MKDRGDPLTLRDMGEFDVIDDVIFKVASRVGLSDTLGDDCGFVQVGDSLIAVSADVGPRPLIQELQGHSNDLVAAGWHAAVATASDIATAGAKPICLVDTIDAPPELHARDLEDFMQGFFAACREFGFDVGGGDIRQGVSLVARVFGMGLVEHGARIGRGSVKPGHRIALIGDAGQFVAAYLRAVRNSGHIGSTADLERLRYPRPQLQSMRLLANEGLIEAASDSSDGVLGALDNLVRKSKCTIRLDLDSVPMQDSLLREATINGYDPWNLFFFWGDWSVVVAIRAERYAEFEEFTDSKKIPMTTLGNAISGPPYLEATVGRRLCQINVMRNENFKARSFNANINDHIEYMLATQLFAPTIPS
jgi:thiamine-monophosphate kinase